MATLTAQNLVGTPHPNHGGINPTHYLFLSENGGAAWILVPQNVFETEQPGRTSKVTWIPTLEHMLEDAILMTAIYVIEDEEIGQMAREYFRNKKANWVELGNDIDPEHLELLYQKCRELPNKHKLVITAFDRSSIRSQLPVVGEYQMDVEVCVPFTHVGIRLGRRRRGQRATSRFCKNVTRADWVPVGGASIGETDEAATA